MPRKPACLHGSIQTIAMQHRAVDPRHSVANAKRPPGGGLCGDPVLGGLFRGFLAWRVEGAGIVNFSDLMIGKAQHLAQDLIGVLAEQR